jgi:hypothetical protein
LYILVFIFKLVNIKCFSTQTPYWDLNYPTQYTYLCSFQTCEDKEHLNPHPLLALLGPLLVFTMCNVEYKSFPDNLYKTTSGSPELWSVTENSK